MNTLAGLWLIISPFVLMAFSNLEHAKWNNVIVGILVGLFSVVRASGDDRKCWSWFSVIMGAWLIISPFVLGFSNVTMAMWHNIILGIIVVAFAWGRLFSDIRGRVVPNT
jgi:hypothetical protein